MHSNKICNTLKTSKNALLEVRVSQDWSVFTSTSTEFKTEAEGVEKLHCTEHRGFIPVPTSSQIPNLSQKNPVHILPSNFWKNHYHPSMPRSYKQSLSLGSPHQNCVSLFTSMNSMPHPNLLLHFDQPTNIWWGLQIMKLHIIVLYIFLLLPPS